MIETASSTSSAPVFILVEPQMGENIGAACRVMGNFGIAELRIVNPRDGWPNPAAITMATGSPVLENARVFDTLEEAVADCQLLYASTAQPRARPASIRSSRPRVSGAYWIKLRCSSRPDEVSTTSSGHCASSANS